jgi:hypothetical protein
MRKSTITFIGSSTNYQNLMETIQNTPRLREQLDIIIIPKQRRMEVCGGLAEKRTVSKRF